MRGLGFTGILLDLDSPESVEQAADEVIALTNNRLYGLFNNAGYGVRPATDSLTGTAGAAVLPQTFRGASAYHAPSPGHAAARRRADRDDLLGDGPDLHAGPWGLRLPVNMRLKPGPMRCAWSCATAVLRSA